MCYPQRHPSTPLVVDALSIRQRPAEVEDRAIPGHGEGDLLGGAKNSYIATLVEHHSRFALLIKVPSKETEAVVAALSQHVRKLPATLKTLADLGSRTRDGQTYGLYGSYRCAGLLLRSAKSLAARHERKHQSAVTAMLPARHRPVGLFASGSEQSGTAAKSASKESFRISNSASRLQESVASTA
jgi:hypothetical protein